MKKLFVGILILITSATFLFFGNFSIANPKLIQSLDRFFLGSWVVQKYSKDEGETWGTVRFGQVFYITNEKFILPDKNEIHVLGIVEGKYKMTTVHAVRFTDTVEMLVFMKLDKDQCLLMVASPDRFGNVKEDIRFLLKKDYL